jgi:hypothetical protein
VVEKKLSSLLHVSTFSDVGAENPNSHKTSKQNQLDTKQCSYTGTFMMGQYVVNIFASVFHKFLPKISAVLDYAARKVL